VGTAAKLRLVHIFEMRHGKVSSELVMETPPQPIQESLARVSFGIIAEHSLYLQMNTMH
jgi:hypothetical protein